MARITIIGAGIMATALTVPMRDNGHDVRVVGTHLDRDVIDSLQTTGRHPRLECPLPDGIEAFQLEDAEAAVEGADVVMSGVNSFGVDWIGEQLARLLRPGQVVLSVTKGLVADDEGNLEIIPRVLQRAVGEELASSVGWAAITGPSIAGEVAVRHDTAVAFCGDNPDLLRQLARTLRTDYYHVWTTTDFVGAEVAAATKNIYAFAAGFGEGLARRQADGAAYGRLNMSAALFAQGAVEMRRFFELLGGDPWLTAHLVGVGDMQVTSAGGRNVVAGTHVGSGVPFSRVRDELMAGVTLEGVNAIRVIGGAIGRRVARGELDWGRFPLLGHLYDVVVDDAELNIPWSRFFNES